MTDLPTLLEAKATQVTRDLAAQDEAWGTGGWTRRRFLAGAGMVGAAALASQLVTTRAAYAADATGTERTLVVVFMRGAADGLRVLVPNASSLGLDYLKSVRGNLVPAASNLIALPSAGGWAINGSLKPLYDALWATGEMGFVPAVSSLGISRSHFQAQQWLESGGNTSLSTGWLDRLLAGMGPGTTFRTVADGNSMPNSLAGSSDAITMSDLSGFKFQDWDGPQARTALETLYRGIDSSLGEDVRTALAAVDTAASATAKQAAKGVYPGDNFSQSLRDIAALLKAEVGMQVATIDVGGWDTHTDEAGDLDRNLGSVAAGLTAFMNDLGPARRSRVTVVLQTEFGRRIAMNDSGGTDHGHGSVMWLLGGGLASSGVFGKWAPLSASATDQGDVQGLNSPFDVLGELAQKRLGVGSMSSVFPGASVSPMGLATAS